MDPGLFPAKVLTFFQDWKARERSITILVLGDCGSGKTSLVNNLLGEEIAQDNAPSVLSTFHGMFQGVPVTVHETSGLENPDGEGNPGYRNEMQSLLSGGGIDVIIYCFKATETRMRESLIRTLQGYHSMKLDWRKTVIALTFSDVLPVPKSARNNPSYDQASYFNSRVSEWKRRITQALTNQICVPATAVKDLRVTPTTGDCEEELPNHEQWFKQIWSTVIDAINAVPSSIPRRNIVPDRPRSSAVHSTTQPYLPKSANSQLRKNQMPNSRTGNERMFGSRDELLSPSSQGEDGVYGGAECICSCLKRVFCLVGSCIVACFKACANMCIICFRSCCKCDS